VTTLPALDAAGWARWAWRTLTSMRTALILLSLLALAAVPGSLLPQRGVALGDVAAFLREHRLTGPWLDRLGFFEVYSAPWFAALYLLLLISMVGCVVPRCGQLWRSTRASPPRAPTTMDRLDGHRRWQSDRGAEEVLEAAAADLRRRRFRVQVVAGEVRAEKGHLRELGNLGFHLSLLVLFVGIAAGALWGYEGRVVVVEGDTFANTRSQYDEFTPGPLFDEERLDPFSLTLTQFSAQFETSAAERGAPRHFSAAVEHRPEPAAAPERTVIEVNHPLRSGATKVFLTGNGYAPRFTVRDGTGAVVFTGPSVFLPRGGNLASEGVVKAPDAQPAQLGFEGFFLPTAAIGEGGPFSAFPAPLNPQAFLTAYTGDLGLSDGSPQSVYSLDKSGLTQVTVDGQPLAQALSVGDTMTLPGGRGSITLDGFSRFANFQIARDPGKEASLAAAVMLLAGLTVSLAVPRRRVWVRARHVGPEGPGSGATVELGSLSLGRRTPPADELAELAALLGEGTPSLLPDLARP
jgi:cytochrome c biogenesis protein